MHPFTASTLPPELSAQLAPPPFALRIDSRLDLRQLHPADAPEIARLVDANRAFLRQWVPWVDRSQTADDVLRFIGNTLRQAAARDGFQAAIRAHGHIVGIIGHHGIDWANRRTTLGYWLAERSQGRGIMTAACRAIVAHAFGDLRLHRIQICCGTANLRSRAIPERLGFTCEGILRQAEWLYDHFVDHAVYARLTEKVEARGVEPLS